MIDRIKGPIQVASGGAEKGSLTRWARRWPLCSFHEHSLAPAARVHTWLGHSALTQPHLGWLWPPDPAARGVSCPCHGLCGGLTSPPAGGRRHDRPTSSNSATSLLPRGANRNSWTPSGPPGAEGGPGLSLRPSCHQIGGSTIFVHRGYRRGPGYLGDGLLHAAWVGHMPLYFQLSIFFFFSQDFIPEDETRTHV